jgi:hypothetical protein
MPPPPTYVLNKKQVVAANLRFNDSNGILVTEMYPVNPVEGQPDSTETGYIMLIGSRLSSALDTINAINAVLDSQNSSIETLENQVAQILASGATAIPQVSGGCLNGNIVDDINVITDLLVENACDYIGVLGTTTALNTSIGAQCPNLNTLPAYSQNTDMAGLAGWVTTPSTVADILNNIQRSICDMRSGVDNALEWATPNCSSIQIQLSGYYNPSNKEITVYTGGSFLPTIFEDNGGSELEVRDSFGNVYTSSFDVEDIIAAGFITRDLTSSGLSQTSKYTVFFKWDVTSTTPSLGCAGTKVITVDNTTVICTPVTLVPGTNNVQYSFTPYINSNVEYRLELLSATGTTVDATAVYTNPTGPVIGLFNNLTPSTTYWIQVTVTVGGEATQCPLYTFETGS